MVRVSLAKNELIMSIFAKNILMRSFILMLIAIPFAVSCQQNMTGYTFVGTPQDSVYTLVSSLDSLANVAGGTDNDTAWRITSASNNAANRIQYAFAITPAFCNFRAVIKPRAASTIIAIGRNDGSQYGTLMRITPTGTVNVCEWTGGSTYTIHQTYTSGINQVVDSAYYIEVNKRSWDYDVHIRHAGQSYSFTGRNGFGDGGSWYGRPSFICINGTMDVMSWSFGRPQTDARVILFGDSFVGDGIFGDSTYRYAEHLADTLGIENVYISGKGGENSAQLLSARFGREMAWLRGKTVIIAEGTNNTDTTVHKNTLVAMRNYIKARGAVPVFVTVTPRTDADNTVFRTAINDWIRNRFHERYIDVNAAVTSDGNNWYSQMVKPDGVHPTFYGHQAIFYRLITDIGDLIKR